MEIRSILHGPRLLGLIFSIQGIFKNGPSYGPSYLGPLYKSLLPFDYARMDQVNLVHLCKYLRMDQLHFPGKSSRKSKFVKSFIVEVHRLHTHS